MRLLDTTTFELRSDSPEFFTNAGYAILSHRWVGAEITFDEIPRRAAELRTAGESRMKSAQLDKIRGACEVARSMGFQWMWIDNCCINKSSTTEESESINSMFKWYRDARVCITYLSDVKLGSSANPPPYQAPEPIRDVNKPDEKVSTGAGIFQSIDSDKPSEWFFRGWTLQELLAPPSMSFFDTDWTFLGTKDSLAPHISHITGIDAAYLTGARHYRKACIATKMSWIAGRTTTRIEDIAYSMLGLFNIMMAPQYGEGQRAFMRLQHQLLSTTSDESLFAWKMPSPLAGQRYDIEPNADTSWGPDEWGLLAPSPDWFRDCGAVTIEDNTAPRIERPSRTFQMSRSGLQIPIMPLEGSSKYRNIMLFSPLLFCFAIPIWIYVARQAKRDAVAGLPFPLNVWRVVDDRTGEVGSEAICLWISVLPESVKTFTGAGASAYKIKRVKCGELARREKYAVRGAEGEVIALQPELRFGD